MSKPDTHPNWFIYIIKCRDNTYYTGITPNIEQRIKTHDAGKGAAYTRGRGPVKLVHSERFQTRSEASVREAAIKKLTRLQKEKLIKNSSV